MCWVHDGPAVACDCRTRRASTRSIAARNGEKTKAVNLIDTISSMLNVMAKSDSLVVLTYGRRVLQFLAQFWPCDMSSIHHVALTMQS